MSYLITPRESVNFTDKLTLAQQRIDAGITGNRLAPHSRGSDGKQPAAPVSIAAFLASIVAVGEAKLIALACSDPPKGRVLPTGGTTRGPRGPPGRVEAAHRRAARADPGQTRTQGAARLRVRAQRHRQSVHDVRATGGLAACPMQASAMALGSPPCAVRSSAKIAIDRHPR